MAATVHFSVECGVIGVYQVSARRRRMPKFDKTWLTDKVGGALISIGVQWFINNPGTVAAWLMSVAVAAFAIYHLLGTLAWIDRFALLVAILFALGGLLLFGRFVWLNWHHSAISPSDQPVTMDGAAQGPWKARAITFVLWVAALCLVAFLIPKGATSSRSPQVIRQAPNVSPDQVSSENGVAVGTINAQDGVVSIGQKGGQTAKTIINNPLAKPKPDLLKLSFSDSPLFTPETQKRITQDLTDFRNYLIGLRFELVSAVPPLSVGSPNQFTKPLELTVAGSEDISVMLPSGGRYEAREYPGHKPSTDFNQNLVLMPAEVADRKTVIAIYGMYAVGQVIDRINPDPDAFFSQGRSLAMAVGGVYFSGSFLNHKYLWYEPSSALWEIRERLGKQTADRLVAFTIRAFTESVYRDREPPSHSQSLYFYNRIKDGAQLLDNDAVMKEVTAIWLRHGLDIK